MYSQKPLLHKKQREYKGGLRTLSIDVTNECNMNCAHFDCDTYVPTKTGLDYLYPLLSRGGVMIFDEYGIPDWPGETKAVDEFLQLHPELQLKCLHWTNSPAAYCVKV